MQLDLDHAAYRYVSYVKVLGVTWGDLGVMEYLARAGGFPPECYNYGSLEGVQTHLSGGGGFGLKGYRSDVMLRWAGNQQTPHRMGDIRGSSSVG